MTERELYNSLGKNVKLICDSNIVIEGFVECFTRSIDNDNGFASIDIRKLDISSHLITIYENEINSIEILEGK